MKNVYFKKITDYDDKDLINECSYEMIKRVINEEDVSFKGTVPLKVHFGEKGNNTFITPDNFEGIKKYLKEEKIDTCYIETNVLYKGSRTMTDDHIKTAKEHGFTDLDIVIADGEDDNMYDNIKIDGKHFKECKIGSKFKDYNNYIVVSHFKGHGLAGFGAAIKQLGMGFASRGGKLNQHSDTVPIINRNKCTACGICVKNCPTNAISIDTKAKIDKTKCVGCAKCTVVCPFNAITNSWGGTNFYEKLAEYAYAASKDKNNVYITYAFNITSECDCNGSHMKLIHPNIGIFVSTDPVAIDRAVLDIIHNGNCTTFDDGIKTLDYAEELGMGNNKYNLVEI